MSPSSFPIDTLRRWRRASLIAAAVGIAFCALAALFDFDQFFRSWLLAVLYWWSIAVGSLGLILLHNLTGGRWGEAIRPFLLSTLIWLPLLAVLLAPILLQLDRVYPWADRQYVAEHAHVQAKQAWLNAPFFLGRAIFYFAVWLVWAWLASAWSQVKSPGVRQFSAAGLVALVLTASFAAIDWAMSLDPLWQSSIYGGIVILSGALSALALGTWLATTFATPEMVVVPADVPRARADLGNLILAFVMLWTYFSLSQFLIIWSANIPEEATWYVARSRGGWQWLAVGIISLAFVAPFASLLSYEVKQSPIALRRVAALILFSQFMHWLWMLGPIYYGERLFLHWADIAALAAVKGILLAALFWRLERLPPLGPPQPVHAMSNTQEGTVHA